MKKSSFVKLLCVDIAATLMLILPSQPYDIWRSLVSNSFYDTGNIIYGIIIRQVLIESMDLYLIPSFSILFTWVVFRCIIGTSKALIIATINALVFCMLSFSVFFIVLAIGKGTVFYPYLPYVVPPRIICVVIVQILIVLFHK